MNSCSVLKRCALALALAGASLGVQAAGVAINPASVSTTTTTVPTVGVEFSGDGVVAFFEVEVAFDQTALSATAAAVNGGNCSANNTTGLIIVQVTDPGLNPLPTGPIVYCDVDFTVLDASTIPGAGDPDVVHPLALQNDLWGDSSGTPVAGNTLTDGEIRITGALPDIVVGPGTDVVFPGGTSGDTVTATAPVNVASGTVGSATVNSCTIAPAVYAIDAAVTFPIPVPAAGATIDLEATLANSALPNGTLTCEVTDSTGTSDRTWNLSAPAGTPVPGPEYSSNPPAGSDIDRTGTPGSACGSTLTIENDGLAGPGSDLDYTCSLATGTDFSITGGAGTLAVGDSAPVSITVTCPADGTTINDTLTCTSNDPALPSTSYALSATGQAFVAPTFIPATSLWSKFALIGVFAALGLLMVGLRRNH